MDITVTSTIYGFGTIATTNETSATYNGVTFTFDTAMPVGYFESGEPFVVSSSAFNITAISPASQVIDATYWGNGAMQDPYLTGGSQGFDALLAQPLGSWDSGVSYALHDVVKGPSGYTDLYICLEAHTSGVFATDLAAVKWQFLSSTTGTLSSPTPYSSGLNVDPAVGGSIAISLGQETSIVKAVRLSGAAVTDWQSQEKYVTLTVLATAPAAGAIRPAPSALTKTVYNMNDINLSVLRDLTMPGSFSESATTSLSYIPDYLGAWGGENGEQRRRFRLDDALHGGGTSNYSAVFAPYYARAILQLHSDATPKAKKYEVASLVIRHGTQIAALIDRGATMNSGAGQGGGIHLWVWAAAFLLKDASLLATAQSMSTQLTSPFWWASADVGKNGWDKSSVSGQTPLPEMVGTPTIVPDAYQSNLDARYTLIGASNVYWEATSLVPFYNFGGDWTARFVNGAYDTTNAKAAVIALCDRFRQINVAFMGSYNVPAQWRDIYDVVRSSSVMPAWTGVPDQVPYGTDTSWDDDYFTAGDGQISWDFKSIDFATETVTRRDFRYSLDGIQWIEVTDVATTGSQTGLLKGAAHWCGLRQVSASGAGAWSANYPYNTPLTSGSDRGKRTTTGTDTAAAPVNTVPPVIHKRLYEQWGYATWEPAGASLAADDTTTLACGNGYWTGYAAAPPMTFTYQWKRDGTPIGGATSQTYSRAAADAETDITCEITATNASGSASVTTAAVTMPALATIPAGTLIDTDFKGAFALDYEAELTSAAGSDATVAHLPFYGGYTSSELDNIDDLNTGALHNDKTGSWPTVTFDLTRQLTAGSSYRLQAQFYSPSGGTGGWTGGTGNDDVDFQLRRTVAGTAFLPNITFDPEVDQTINYSEAVGSGTVITSGYVTDIDITFDVDIAESEVDVTVWFRHDTNSGGTATGDIYLTYLKISEVV